MSTNNAPLVSILSSSFNHEKYVKFFIDSVLAQTAQNWELIIVDDCSTDNNVAEIKKYHDPRIKLIRHPFNMGMNCASMTGLAHARGKYIAQCASDDMLMPNFVQRITDFMDAHPNIGVLYTGLQCIDNQNNIMPHNEIHSAQGTRYEILRKLFYEHNCMTSPGQVIRRTEYEKIQPLDIAISQHQDYKIHVRLLLNTECAFLNENLVLYRAPSGKSGISFSTPLSRMRCALEEGAVMDAFLEIDDIKTLQNIFGTDLDKFGKITKNLIPYVLGTLAMDAWNISKRRWGYSQVVKFINNMDNYKLVNKQYGFCFRDFLELANKFLTENTVEYKYHKYKNLFNTTIQISCVTILILIILLAIK